MIGDENIPRFTKDQHDTLTHVVGMLDDFDYVSPSARHTIAKAKGILARSYVITEEDGQ